MSLQPGLIRAPCEQFPLTMGACIALEKRFACLVISSCSSRGSVAYVSYFVPMSTGIAVCHISEFALRSTQTHFVEASSLTIPLFNAVECCFACEIKHEQDGNRIITDERQHRDEFPLATEIPYLEPQWCN